MLNACTNAHHHSWHPTAYISTPPAPTLVSQAMYYILEYVANTKKIEELDDYDDFDADSGHTVDEDFDADSGLNGDVGGDDVGGD